ncbi:hypothetical protein CA51_41420 [Rosistilla oblonga]|uniref:hypothetical protein n=1 Tax=Rosistilla oblonga TaxID=2527990 RepID=UPI001187DC64|nr:hypothetical protein [Rosistilla oblonga]QDV14245.1 hypothetical protein CA51_41420 [Rosistilla oblonga]
MKSLDTSSRWRMIVKDVVLEPLSEHEFAVYNSLYSDSYMLNAIDAQILRTLCEMNHTAIDMDVLVRLVAASLDLPIDQRLLQYTEESIAQLAHVGIVCLEATN